MRKRRAETRGGGGVFRRNGVARPSGGSGGRPSRARRARWAGPVGAWVAGCALLLGCGEADGDASVAQVDGRPIPLAELRRTVEARFEADPEAPRADVLSEELERLVNQRVALNRARVLGIEVTDAEVEDRIRLVHGEEWRLSDPLYHEEVRHQMEVDRTAIRELAPHIGISESALADYFEAHREDYAQPERIRIRQIVVEDATRARALWEQLRGGADFETLAARHSLAPEAEAGGLLPPFAAGELPEAFDRAFQLEVGQVSEVIESPHGYHIFSIVEKMPPTEPELADIREELTAKLAHEKLMALRPQWLRDLRRSADIRVHDRMLETLKR